MNVEEMKDSDIERCCEVGKTMFYTTLELKNNVCMSLNENPFSTWVSFKRWRSNC